MRLRLVLGVLAACAAGCIFFVDPDAQCSQDSDCKGAGKVCQSNHICGVPGGGTDAASGSTSSGSGSGSVATSGSSGSNGDAVGTVGSAGTSDNGSSTGSSSSSGSTGTGTAGPIGTFVKVPLNGDGARYGPGEIRIGARMYLIGGSELGSVYPLPVVMAVLRADGGSIDFEDIGSPLITGRHHPVIVKLDHDLYVIGGELPDGGVADDETTSVYVDGGFGAFSIVDGGMLHFPRYGASMARQNGACVIAGGFKGMPDGGTVFETAVEGASILNDGGLGPFNVAVGAADVYRAFADATPLGSNAIAVAGGVDRLLFSDKSIDLAVPYADGGGSGFSSNTNTNLGHIDGKVFARSGRLHVLSGVTELFGNVTPENEAFDYTPANGNLTPAVQSDAPLNEARAGFVVDYLSGYLYVVGGVSGDAGIASVNYAPDVEIAPLP